MKKLSLLTSIILAVVMLLTLCACNGGETPTDTSSVAEKTKVKIATLSGPTGMGMAKMMSEPATDMAEYNFTVEADPQTLASAMINAQYDIAALPVNVASAVYNKTNGGVKIAAVNTLGNLYIISKDTSIKHISDLKGKTIITAGQGATPEYALKYLLKQNGIDPEKDVTIEFKSEHAEVSTLLTTGMADIGLLPEPAATTAINKDNALTRVLDLNKIWDEVHNNQYKLTQGCIVVSAEFAETHKDVLDEFLKNYKNSVDFTNNNTDEAATLIEQNKIFASAKVAAKSIPVSKICYVDGDDMKKSVANYLDVLFAANPKAVGGKVPADDFYYYE